MILNIFIWLRKFLVYSKIWAQRTMSWISIANSGMILFLVLSKLQDYGINLYITKWFFPIFALTIFLLILLGYVEDKAGFHNEEMKTMGDKNPTFNEILKRLDRIEKRIRKPQAI